MAKGGFPFGKAAKKEMPKEMRADKGGRRK